jgi:hypothetical protein
MKFKKNIDNSIKTYKLLGKYFTLDYFLNVIVMKILKNLGFFVLIGGAIALLWNTTCNVPDRNAPSIIDTNDSIPDQHEVYIDVDVSNRDLNEAYEILAIEFLNIKEKEVKDLLRHKVPKKALNEVSLKDNRLLILEVEKVIKAQILYLSREYTIDYNVLDSLTVTKDKTLVNYLIKEK